MRCEIIREFTYFTTKDLIRSESSVIKTPNFMA